MRNLGYTRYEMVCEKEQNRTWEQNRATDFVNPFCSILSQLLFRNPIPVDYKPKIGREILSSLFNLAVDQWNCIFYAIHTFYSFSDMRNFKIEDCLSLILLPN